MNTMRPAAGAFATGQSMPQPGPSGGPQSAPQGMPMQVPQMPPQGGPMPQPGPDMGQSMGQGVGGVDQAGLGALMERLKAMGVMGGGPGAGLNPGGASVPMAAPPRPQRSPLDDLAGMVGRAPTITSPGRPQKTKFTPGKPGIPKSGMTAHEMMRDPDIVKTLHGRISQWERANPTKTLKGSHIQQMLPEVSASQARTLRRMLDQARTKRAVGNIEELLGRGALKASTR